LFRKKAQKQSKAIDDQLKAEVARKAKQLEYRMLLLGSSDSGKTTILKQLKVLYAEGFSGNEKDFFKRKIVDNIIDNMTLMVQALTLYNIPIQKAENQPFVELVSSGIPRDEDGLLTPESLKAMKELWKDESIQKVFLKGNEYGLQDTADYFLNNVSRIGETNYNPINDDIIRARFRTIDVSENRFLIKGATFTVFDVGGHRKLRLFCKLEKAFM
jgi:energy-coupling factor transporter ATP-binding protein EcfA2